MDDLHVQNKGIMGLTEGRFGYLNSAPQSAQKSAPKSHITMHPCYDLHIMQLAFFADQQAACFALLKRQLGINGQDAGGHISWGKGCLVLRPEPTKIWILSPKACPLTGAENFYPLDISASKITLRITGVKARALLNRHIAIDFRTSQTRFIACPLHHVPIHILQVGEGWFDLFIPRSYAESLAHLLFESARPFGVEITKPKAWTLPPSKKIMQG